MAIVRDDELETAVLVESSVGPDGIYEQSTLRWRSAYLPGGRPDPRLEWVDEVVVAHLGEAELLTVATGTHREGAVFVTPGLDTREIVFVSQYEGCVHATQLGVVDGVARFERLLTEPGCRSGSDELWQELRLPADD